MEDQIVEQDAITCLARHRNLPPEPPLDVLVSFHIAELIVLPRHDVTMVMAAWDEGQAGAVLVALNERHPSRYNVRT